MPITRHESRISKLLEMERERRRRNVEFRRQIPCRHSLQTRLNEAPEDVQTRFLGQGGESGDDGFFFHIYIVIEL